MPALSRRVAPLAVLAALASPPAASAATPAELAEQYLQWCQKNIQDGQQAKADKHCGWYEREAKTAGLKVYGRSEIETAVAGGTSLSAAAAGTSTPGPTTGTGLAEQYLGWCQNNIQAGQQDKADKHCGLYAREAQAVGLRVYSRAEIEAAVAGGTRLSAAGAGTTPSPAPGSKVASDRSGLPWASGMSCFKRTAANQAEIEAWRGRKLDVVKGWAPITTWPRIFKWLNGGGFRSLKDSGARTVVSVPLFPASEAPTFAACASGAFNSYYRRIAQTLVDRGAPDTIIRLGWEANGSWYPWSAGKDPEGYKACFRQAAQTMKKVDKRLLIEWPMAKKGHLSYSVERIYPGNDVVDIVGVVLYDRYPTSTTQLIWDDLYDQKFLNGPYGPKTWIDFAKSKNKRLGIGEWGVSDGSAPGVGSDNPLFIENMFAFFARNAANIAYESYYNCQDNGIYRIYPEDANPLAAAAYQRLWQSGPDGVTLPPEPTGPLPPEAADAEKYLGWFQKSIREGDPVKADKNWGLYVTAATKAGIPLWTRAAVEAEVLAGNKVSALGAPG